MRAFKEYLHHVNYIITKFSLFCFIAFFLSLAGGWQFAKADETCVQEFLRNTAFHDRYDGDAYDIEGLIAQNNLSFDATDTVQLCEHLSGLKEGQTFGQLVLKNYLSTSTDLGSLKVFLPTKSIKEVSYSESFTILDENIGRRFEFSFQNNDGDIIGTTNIYTALNNDVAAINFLISSEAEIGTGSGVTDELKGDLVPVGPHAVLRVSDGDQACGGLKYPIFPERIERARAEQALRGVVDILLYNQVPIPNDESDKLRDVIAECFFKLKLGS